MVTGEGLSRIEIDVDDELDSEWARNLVVAFGIGDVADCFHRLRLDGDIGQYFCWPPLSASALNVSSVDGVSVNGDDLVWPMQASLGMGFSWATYFAQQVNIGMLRKAIYPIVSTELTDNVGVWVLKRCQNLAAHHAYIDNLGGF